MMAFPASIARFWRERFPVAPTSAASVGLAVATASIADRRVMILETADGETRAVVTPEIAAMLGEPDGAWTLATLKARLDAIHVMLHGADHLFYFPEATAALLRDTPVDPSVRRLTETDAAVFAAFEAEATEEDLDGAAVDLDDWAVFGAFENGRLVAIASIYPWNDSQVGSPFADIGVLTLAAARRKGHAARLIRTCAAHALEEGYALQYRCQLDNLDSVALARSMGLQRFGSWTPESSESA